MSRVGSGAAPERRRPGRRPSRRFPFQRDGYSDLPKGGPMYIGVGTLVIILIIVILILIL